MPTRGNEITEPSQCEVGRGARRLGSFAVYLIRRGRDEHGHRRGENWAKIIGSLANGASLSIGISMLTSVIIRMPAHSLFNSDFVRHYLTRALT